MEHGELGLTAKDTPHPAPRDDAHGGGPHHVGTWNPGPRPSPQERPWDPWDPWERQGLKSTCSARGLDGEAGHPGPEVGA